MTAKPLHLHLMVEGDIVLSQIRQFAEAGADLVTIHAENGAVVDEALSLIGDLGCEAGLVLRVETPVETLAPWLERVAFVTLLGTAIGVKGKDCRRPPVLAFEAVGGCCARQGARRRCGSPPTAASATRPCRCSGPPAPRPWSWGRSPSATPTSRGGSPGCMPCRLPRLSFSEREHDVTHNPCRLFGIML